MTLAEIEALPSFALLGPGFGGAPFLLLRDLRPALPGEDALVFAPFEGAGERAIRLAAAEAHPCDPALGDAREIDVELDAGDHAAKVEAIREAIADGDVYQVCLTARAHLGPIAGGDLLSLLCRRGLPRFAAWVRLPGGAEFVSASPELFFETDGRRVHAEPMKGTARPSAGDWLAASGKDRCELAMITDLVRNDLAPICEPGTIRVENPRRLVELPYAVQAVSDVAGILRASATPLDVLAALHPGGSVTGAPKRAALDRIRRLEPSPRGAYCGALGWWTADRSTFALLIRTAERSAQGWTYGVGGGIVFESEAAAELEELHVKLGALRAGP